MVVQIASHRLSARSLREGNLDLQIQLLIRHVYNRLQQLIFIVDFLLGLVSFYLQLSRPLIICFSVP